MGDLVYRGVRYSKEDLAVPTSNEVPVLRYRGVEFDPRDAWRMGRPIFARSYAKVYRGVSDGDDDRGGNAPALI